MTLNESKELLTEAASYVGTSNVFTNANGDIFGAEYFFGVFVNSNGEDDVEPMGRLRDLNQKEWDEPLRSVIDKFKNIPKSSWGS